MLNQEKKKRFESFKTNTIRTEEMLYVKGGVCCGGGDPPPGDPPPTMTYPDNGQQKPPQPNKQPLGNDDHCTWNG